MSIPCPAEAPGIPGGVLTEDILLAALLYLWVIPKEAETVDVLLRAKVKIEAYYDDHKAYPDPTAGERLMFESGGAAVIDGFARPLLYKVEGRGRVASFVVRSYGFNG